MKLDTGIILNGLSEKGAASTSRTDAYLTKQVTKLLGRIERLIIPVNSIKVTSISRYRVFYTLLLRRYRTNASHMPQL